MLLGGMGLGEANMWKIGLLGGTGNEGRGLALRFALAGEDVIIGSRSSSRAEQAAAAIREQLRCDSRHILAHTNEEAAREADLVFLCLPVAGLEQTLGDLRPALRGKTVIEVINPIRRTGDGFDPVPVPARSAGEWVAALLPEAAVVSAFKTLSASALADIGRPLQGDAFVCGDRQSAKKAVLALAGCMPRLRAVDCGPLRNSRYVEAATVLLLELNRRHHATTALQILGLPSPG